MTFAFISYWTNWIGICYIKWFPKIVEKLHILQAAREQAIRDEQAARERAIRDEQAARERAIRDEQAARERAIREKVANLMQSGNNSNADLVRIHHVVVVCLVVCLLVCLFACLLVW
jgi:hypothetical protein